MQQAIEDLLRLGAINPWECQFLSSNFLVDKSNGGKKFVLNLKELNSFIRTDQFKLEDIRSASKLISRGSYMTTLDLQDAYFLVPIHKSNRKFLRFVWKDWIFEFQCLPFGLCTTS